MAKTYSGHLGKLGDTPGTAGIAEHDAQHLRGFWLEQRLELAPLGGRHVWHEPLDEDTVENEACIAFEVEKSDLVRTAERLRLR